MNRKRLIGKVLGNVMLFAPVVAALIALWWFAGGVDGLILVGCGILGITWILLGGYLASIDVSPKEDISKRDIDYITTKINILEEEIKGIKEVQASVKGKRLRKEEVADWRRDNPMGTKAECVRSTGLPKSTVYTYWKEN